MTYSENRVKKIRKIALVNEKLVANAIKTYGKDVEGYKVIGYSEIGRKINKSPMTVRDVCKRLESKNLLEIKESYALFGTVQAKGFKFKGDEE